MDIGARIKAFRVRQGLSQEELALQIFVSRQTISNWETNKSCPDVKSLIALAELFHVSLDDFLSGEVKEMRRYVEQTAVTQFRRLGALFLIELLLLTVSAYPLFCLDGYGGVALWLGLLAVTVCTAGRAEALKKRQDVQTCKEILAFLDGRALTHDETQQELGKRNYQRLLFALAVGGAAAIISLAVILLCRHGFG